MRRHIVIGIMARVHLDRRQQSWRCLLQGSIVALMCLTTSLFAFPTRVTVATNPSSHRRPPRPLPPNYNCVLGRTLELPSLKDIDWGVGLEGTLKSTLNTTIKINLESSLSADYFDP